ncbi:MAG TPA: RIP metalloprotease RseP [Opitutus sp.]|nr:RIP metalloprotease RseP [Opitutus sp.]
MPSDLLQTLFSNVWSIFLVVVFFGGSIFVHELGHFLAARRRGVHVERFSIGFGPAIFSWHRHGVEYRVAWFPLGGYVLLPQLADLGAIEGRRETDPDTLPPVSYSSKMIVFAAGACFNVLFAFSLAAVIWVIGQPESNDTSTTRIGYVSPTLELSNGRAVPSPASEAGLKVGDVIRAIDGAKVDNWRDVQYLVGLGAGQTADGRRKAVFTIERDGRTFNLTVNPRLSGEDRDRHVGIAPAYQLIVSQVEPGSPAEHAGFQAGDEILSVNGTPILGISSYADEVEDATTRTVEIRVKRAGTEHELTLPPRPNAKPGSPIGLALTIGFHLTHPSPFKQLWENVTMTFRTLWSLLNPHSDIGLSKLSGPVGIVRIFHSAAEAGIRVALIFTILVNVNLAVFNLLPLPILDGGQMLFATIARIRGRALPANFIIAAQSTFGVLLIAMFFYVTVFGDIRRWVNDVRAEHAEAAAQLPTPPPQAAPAKP